MLQQQRNGGDFVGLFLGRLLAKDDLLARRPGGDEMQGIAALAPVMAAPRGLAINGDDLGIIVAQAADPGHEAGFKQLRVQRREHVTQHIVARDAAFVGVKASEKGQMLDAPQRCFYEVARPGDRRRQHQKQDFR